jgi:hypothetical protein
MKDENTELRRIGSPRTSSDSDNAAERLIAATPRTSSDIEAGAVETDVPLPEASSGTSATSVSSPDSEPKFRIQKSDHHSLECRCKPGCRQTAGWGMIKEGAMMTTVFMVLFHLCLSSISKYWWFSGIDSSPARPSYMAAEVPIIASAVPQPSAPQSDSLQMKNLHSELDILKAAFATIDAKIDNVNATLYEVMIDGGNDNRSSSAKVARSEEGTPVPYCRPHACPQAQSSCSSLPTNSSTPSPTSCPSSSQRPSFWSFIKLILSVVGLTVSALAMSAGCHEVYVGAEEYLNTSAVWPFIPAGACVGLVIFILTLPSRLLEHLVLEVMWGMVIGLDVGIAWLAIDTAAAAV